MAILNRAAMIVGVVEMTHDEAQKRLTEWVSGELGGWQGRSVARHVAECPECAAEAAEVRALWASLSELRMAKPPRVPTWPTASPAENRQERRTFEFPSFRRQLLLPALGMVAFLTTLLVPQARSLVGDQLRTLTRSRNGGAVETAWQASQPINTGLPMDQRYQRELYRRWFENATRYSPDSFRLQFGRALVADIRFPFGKALQGLQAGFPGQPAADAAVLQQLCRSLPLPAYEINEEWRRGRIAAASSQLLNFREEMGAILTRNPHYRNNAFYPLMEAVYWRSVADLESDPAAEKNALAALHHAASLKHYEDYAGEQAAALSVVSDAAAGYPSAFARWSALRTLPIPYTERYLRVGEGALEQILLLERQGKAREALTSREDLLTVGELLINKTEDPMAQRTGWKYISTATLRPGGAEEIRWQAYLKPGETQSLTPPVMDRYQQALDAAWETYATRLGRPELVTRYQAARERYETWERRTSTVSKRYFMGVPDLKESLIAQEVSALLLGAVVSTLLIGGFVFAITKRGRDVSTVPPAVGWGLGAGVLTTLAWVLNVGVFNQSDMTICLVISILAGSLARVFALRDDTPRRYRLAWFSGALLGAWLAIALVSLVPAGVAEAARGVEAILAGASGPMDTTDPDGRLRATLFSLFCATPALLMLLVLGVIGWVRKVSFVEGAVYGLRRIALPLLGGLLLLYVGSLFAAIHFNTQARTNLEEMYQDRNRYTDRILAVQQSPIFSSEVQEADGGLRWLGNV